MDTNPNQPDAAIDKVLAALHRAAPPEGMNSRIAARIAAQPSPAASHWHQRLTAPTPTAAWWRGAATGDAFALLVVAAVLLVQHTSRKSPPTANVAVIANAAPSIAAVKATGTPAVPCAHPALLRAVSPSPLPGPEVLRAETGDESAAPSRPAPVLPLTSQERALSRLVRTADPSQLAALSPDTEARLEAYSAAEHARLFTPTPPQLTPVDTPATTVNQETVPAAIPDSSPDTSPEPLPAASPESNPAPSSGSSPSADE